MTVLLIALLAAITAATVFVLADSGLRMWSAIGAFRAQQSPALPVNGLPVLRSARAANITTQVSYARTAAYAPLRAAA